MGYRSCGQIRVARVGGKYFFWREPVCDQYGMDVGLNA
jgi:hypothetical protein